MKMERAWWFVLMGILIMASSIIFLIIEAPKEGNVFLAKYLPFGICFMSGAVVFLITAGLLNFVVNFCFFGSMAFGYWQGWYEVNGMKESSVVMVIVCLTFMLASIIFWRKAQNNV